MVCWIDVAEQTSWRDWHAAVSFDAHMGARCRTLQRRTALQGVGLLQCLRASRFGCWGGNLGQGAATLDGLGMHAQADAKEVPINMAVVLCRW